jgi:hypothetical protein
MKNLNEFKVNFHSQFGEDGMLRELINRLPEASLNRTAIEFGAWDGLHLSNIANLVQNHGFRACFIEADSERFKDLKRNYPEGHTLMNRFVTTSGKGSLDYILKECGVDQEPDLISIDIDGNDLNVWKSLKIYRPKIVVIEYNPTIPKSVHFIQDDNFEIKIGNSARAIVEYAQETDYCLVGSTETNLIFLDKKYFVHTSLNVIEYNESDFNNRIPVFVFTGYDGSIHLSEKVNLIWHNLEFENKDFQVLPKRIRKSLSDYNSTQKFLFRVWVIFRFGIKYAKRRREHFRN